MKSKFIYIEPKTINSKFIFELDFKQLHTCKIIKKENDRLFVKSIAGEYYFWVNNQDDPNWKIVK